MSYEPDNKQHSAPVLMAEEVDRFVDGLAKAAKTKIRMPEGSNRICVCGMGGSAMSGDIIADAVLTSWDVPIQIIRSIGIPNWVDEKTLVVASSYSGNTKETLMMYDQAKAKGCKIIGITSGGELKDKCLRDGNRLLEVPTNMQPRSSSGYMIGYLANIIESMGGPKIKAELLKLVPTLRRFRGSIWMKNKGSYAKQIAEKIHGTVPAIYAAGPLLSVAVRWKNQINENSKMLAFSGTIPEMNHNEIMGWAECTHRSKLIPLFLCEEGASESLISMMNESIKILRASGLEPEVVTVWGKTELERSLKVVMLGDYVSLFLASLNGVDPMDVGQIASFKQRLAILLGRKKADKKKIKKSTKEESRNR
ncbi:MAG: bifunctional phosphoglucose/phosphomannose isomerase [Methanomassiliicoccaceae archaeon]|jgi:glucose/mannose-6-phosphate isomerase|nr:bifunctional phosphoglucose/phosphomannose isomerase [Methanomassiliicoccaceae archaeon]